LIFKIENGQLKEILIENLTLFILLLLYLFIFNQIVMLFYTGDTLQYKACIEAKTEIYYQFQREFQETLDNAIKICPNFIMAERKSTAYLKVETF
jgi:hypothetical protein